MAAGRRRLIRRRPLLAAAAGSLAGFRTGTAAADDAGWRDAAVNGMRYKILPPERPDASARYPALLYLHQLDMGTYPAELLKQIDPWFNAPAFRDRHACLVVAPLLDQSRDPKGRTVNFGGVGRDHAGRDNAVAALRQVMAAYPIDADRVYVTGNSMGGIGTWAMLLSFNRFNGPAGRIFAAGMPLAGADYAARPETAAARLRAVPIWAFHGAHDTMVPLTWDRRMARLLAGSRTFRYTEYPSLGHDVWSRTYGRTDVWRWLFSQKAPLS